MKFKVAVMPLLSAVAIPAVLLLPGCAASQGGKEKEIQVVPAQTATNQAPGGQTEAMQQAARAMSQAQRSQSNK